MPNLPPTGMKDRETGQITSQVVEYTDAPTLQGFVREHSKQDTVIFTDEARAYEGLNRPQEEVKNSVKEYVHGQAHVNGMESHWAMLKRGYIGVYHHMSENHLGRYVSEFAGRHNVRPLDTTEQMAIMAANADGRRLTYTELIGPSLL